jgi:N-acetylglucosaminyldiphosphoundecaprenol N-acetyl-beta-D-mannosaminyltransferase
MTATLSSNIYPDVVQIEGIDVAGFPDPQSLFERIVLETKQAAQTGKQRLIHAINIHIANTALHNKQLKRCLQTSDLVYCDGAGIVWGAKMLGQVLPVRLTAADWFADMLGYFAKKNCTVFLLGGLPGVAEAALEEVEKTVPNHSVVGVHHGYILKDSKLEDEVINHINALNPDIVIVGFGVPLQEVWMEKNKHRLNARTLYAIGATMDFISKRVSRCPEWVGKLGFEWLYRFVIEPQRMFGRYVIGNPWFLSRMAFQAALQNI